MNNLYEYGFGERQYLKEYTVKVSISDSDKVISIVDDNQLIANISMELEDETLKLIGKDDEVISTIDIPSVHCIKEASYDEETKKLNLVVILEDDTEKTISIDLTEFIDIYTAGEGVIIEDNKISVDTAMLDEIFATDDDMEAMEESISELTESIDKIKDEISTISGDVETAKELISNCISSVTSTSDNIIVAQEDGVVTIDFSLSAENNPVISGLQESIDGIESAQTEMSESISSISGAVSDLEQSIKYIESGMSEMSDAIYSATTDISYILDTAIPAIDENIFLKQDKLIAGAGIGIDGNEISCTIDVDDFATKDEVSGYADSISAIEANVEAISGSIENYDAKISDLSGDVATLSENISAVSGDVEDNKLSISALDSLISQISGKAFTNEDSLENAIATLSESVDAISGSVDSISGEIGTVDAKIDELSINVGTALSEKQNTLTAGENISIENDVISCTIETAQFATSGDIQSLSELALSALSTAESVNNTFTAYQESNDARLDGDEENITNLLAMSASVEAISGSVDAISSSMTSVTADIVALSAQVSSNTIAINDANTRITELSDEHVSLMNALSGKQDTLTAGEGISIENNVISCTAVQPNEYTAGDGISIEDNVISCTVNTDNFITMSEFFQMHKSLNTAEKIENATGEYTLNEDLVLCEPLVINASSNFVLNLNQHSITTNDKFFDTSAQAVIVINGDVTISDGSIVISDNYSDLYSVKVNSGTLNMSNVEKNGEVYNVNNI